MKQIYLKEGKIYIEDDSDVKIYSTEKTLLDGTVVKLPPIDLEKITTESDENVIH